MSYDDDGDGGANFDDDDEDEIEDLEESELEEDVVEGGSNDDAIQSRELAEFQAKLTSREKVYSKLYEGNYKTIPILTKFERARVLGVRAAEIANGAPTLVEIGDLKDPKEIARKELANGCLPFLIGRILPRQNTRKPDIEVRRVKDLINRY
jgi:DNA-directed RNA polymerase I, II, and III subunit RPABC2